MPPFSVTFNCSFIQATKVWFLSWSVSKNFSSASASMVNVRAPQPYSLSDQTHGVRKLSHLRHHYPLPSWRWRYATVFFSTERGNVAKTPLTHAQEVLGSNFCREQTSLKFSWFSSALPGKCWGTLRYVNNSKEMEFTLLFPGSWNCVVWYMSASGCSSAEIMRQEVDSTSQLPGRDSVGIRSVRGKSISSTHP